MFPLHISQSYRPHCCTDLSEGLSFWAAQEQIYIGGMALSFKGDTSGIGVRKGDSSDASTLSIAVWLGT